MHFILQSIRRARKTDYCDENDFGGAVHRCIHAVIHLIEDHAKRADIPVRFAASKIIEGDPLILKLLQLDENEKRCLSILYFRWRQREVLTEVRQLQI